MWGGGGTLKLYAYLPPAQNPDIMTSAWGSNVKFDHRNGGVPRAGIPGIWHCIEQFVKINDVGQPNGVINCWLDGELALVLDTVTFRTVANGEGLIGAAYFSTFHGGSSIDWAPDTTGFIYYDNLVVAQEYIGPAAEAPTVTLATDLDGATLQQGHTATFTATASQNTARVVFYLNGAAIGEDTDAPYELSHYLAPGSYDLRARAVSDRNLMAGSQLVSFTVNPAPLQSPDTTLSPVDDAYTRGGTHADENHGSENILVVKTEGGEENTRDIHIKFDITGLPSIGGARLLLHCTGTDRAVRPAVYAGVDNGWTEESVTWNTAQQRGDMVVAVPVAAGDSTYEFDITPLVLGLAPQAAALSVVVRDAATAGGWTTFASKESGSNGPRLQLVLGNAVSTSAGMRMAAPGARVVWQNREPWLEVYTPARGEIIARNLKGRLVYRRTLEPGLTRVDLSGAHRGTLLVTIRSEGQSLLSDRVTIP
jgi:hypothetical protein